MAQLMEVDVQTFRFYFKINKHITKLILHKKDRKQESGKKKSKCSSWNIPKFEGATNYLNRRKG